MPGVRRVRQLIAVLLAVAAPLNAADKSGVGLTVQQFADLALKNSLRSRTNEDNFAASRWGWKASRRALSWPTMTASASEERGFSDDDVATTVDTRVDQGTLSLKQPMLTGTILSLGGTWTDGQTVTDVSDAETFSRTKEVPAFSASVTQPLFIFTGNESLRARRAANLGWANDQDSYRAERLSIEQDARSVYYNLFLQSETAQVEQKKYESARLVNNTTRALVRAGKLAEVESVRAEIRSQSDERRIQNAESNLEKVMNQAKDLILFPPEKSIVIVSDLAYKPFVFSLDKILATAVDYNPALLIAQRNVELAEIALRRTRETDRPFVNATGTYGLTRNRANDAVPLDPYGWTAKVGFDWVFFDADQTRLQTKQAQVTLQNAKRSYESEFRLLKVSIQNAYVEIKRIEEQINGFEPQRAAAERNVQAIRLQFRNGLTRLTDVFDAENQLRDLELEYLNLLVNFQTAQDNMKVLVGKELVVASNGRNP